MILGFHFDDDETLNIIDMCAGSHCSPTDQYLSQRAMEGFCDYVGRGDSSMGALTFYGELNDDDRLALALLDAESMLRPGGYRSVDGTAWVDANAATILHGDRAWFGDAAYYSTIEEAEKAYADFSEEYDACLILSHLDALDLVAPAAWHMPSYREAVDQIREANAFTEDEWDIIVVLALEADGS